ncbi:hypothetical protein Pyn_16265 [Prunus yedoensis var. nudiflora]|uniref:Uncharacterized protein n=1 Tax=Prunus yedoensis var. nudiflora TaxID=2094558 RepID=A0A314Z4U6_PRUYE|nr:hypothetical protein Pyn_16265 [Prunus yedoensis var. nudiflora]
MKEDHRQDKLEEMEKSLTQLVEDLRLLLASSASSANPSQPETTKIPNSTVHEAVNPYLSIPMEGENASMNCPICLSSLYCMPVE